MFKARLAGDRQIAAPSVPKATLMPSTLFVSVLKVMQGLLKIERHHVTTSSATSAWRLSAALQTTRGIASDIQSNTIVVFITGLLASARDAHRHTHDPTVLSVAGGRSFTQKIGPA